MTAVEWFSNRAYELFEEWSEGKIYRVDLNLLMSEATHQAKLMEKEQRGYSESDMRSYASYILNNPVIEPSQWYKIYRTKSE